MARRVVVTGMGAVTPLGSTVDTFWDNIRKGQCGIKMITKFDTEEFKVKVAGEVEGFDPELYMTKKDVKRNDLFAVYALGAAVQAFEDSGLDMEKEDAGEMILAACKEMKATEPIPLGSYRGFQMELSFDSFRHDFDITLKGAVSHRVSLGTDARGNIIRLDNALSSIPEKLEKAHEQLTNLQNQQEATRAELGKPFPQEAELAEKSARLAELDAALNMEDSMPEREEAEQADKPSVLADLKAKSEHIPPYRASGGREEVL